MKVALINPPEMIAGEEGGSGFGARSFVKQLRVLPPLGLAYIAAVLKDASHDTVMIDANALRIEPDEVVRRVHDASPEAIGITCVTPLFPVVVEARYPLPGPEVAPPHVHNLFLQVGVDLGLPGMIAYLVLFITCLVRVGQAVTAFRTRENAGMVALSAGLLGSLVVAGVHGLLDAATWGARPSPLLWILLALSLATYRFSRQKAI